MKYTISDIEYKPGVGSLDMNGTIHFEIDITEDSVSLYPTAYKPNGGTIQRLSHNKPIFTYNYETTRYTDSNHEIHLAVPQDE